MRQTNARMWGHLAGVERDKSDPVKLGGCGRPVDPGQRVPIYNHDGRWVPGSLATCDNALLCDYCAPRYWAAASERAKWHFSEWEAGGGLLLHIRLSVPHTLTDDFDRLRRGLVTGFNHLRKSTAWQAAGIVDAARVLDITWSPVSGWHPHYHVTCLVKPGFDVDFDTKHLPNLQAAYRDGLYRAGFSRARKSHGLLGRFFGSTMRALYAWDHRGDYEPEPSVEPVHARELDPDYDPQFGDPDYGPDYDPQSLGLLQIAEAALAGDRRAWCLWAEVCRGLKGKPVVWYSQTLNELWRIHQAEQPAEESTVQLDPVMLVESRVWERARRAGVTQLALAVGFEHGPRGLAQFWASELGVPLMLKPSGCGPPVLAMAE